MNSIFGKDYSTMYDALYEDKNYDSECDLVEKIFHDYGTLPVHSILDLGCGTGNHSLRLAERGYRITGVDRSKDMLDIARMKSDQMGLNCEFLQSDIREFDNNKKYDAVIMMFAVLGYHLENEDVLRALNTVRRHLNKGGLFICDIWYGPAVLTQKPGQRVRVLEGGDAKIIRFSSGSLNTFHHYVDVHYYLLNINGNQVVSEIKEDHSMRFFFPQEMALFFKVSGIELKDIRAFPEWDEKPDDTTWNIGVVGSAV
jgi:2-polyprenyl-3-methyl-5-hydroxy-6-metoxy-1,4-benzoquinol methylase